MSQPKGFVKPGEKDKVCLLQQSLYGLKQSPCQWYIRFDSFILRIGFIRCENDSYVYNKQPNEGSFIYLLPYVDDFVVAAKNKLEINKM